MPLAPPYISFPALLRCLEALVPVAPNILTREAFGNVPASTANQMMQAFRFLRLIGPDGKVSPEMRMLVEHPDTRRPTLAKVLRQAYPEILTVSDDRIATAVVETVISRSGLNAATQRKAVVFFLNAAEYAGLSLDASDSQERPFQQRREGDQPNRNRIQLDSGGFIEISFDLDLFRASKEERELLLDLVDRLRAYEMRREAQGENRDEFYNEAPF